MKLFAFETGREKELCLAELLEVIGKENFVEQSYNMAIFRLEDIRYPQDLQDKLGGTIKIVEIFSDSQIGSPFNVDESDIKNKIQTYLEENFKDHSGKIPFAISLSGFKRPTDINIKELLTFSKKILKSLGLNSRFVNKNFQTPKSSTIYKAKVVEKGVDICLIKSRKGILIGNTISIQNIDAYSKRDYEKPGRDAKIGMLPPKLSQIMLNLAGETETIFDPFCGTGTILLEGLLMKKKVVGSDNNPKMVEYSNKNCNWLKETFRTSEEFRVFDRDARFIVKADLPEKIDAIITEGYLGRPLTGPPSTRDAETIFRELSNLHLNWLKTASSFLDQGKKIVMCLTAIKTKEGVLRFPRFKEIAEIAGFKIIGSHNYQRPDQIVLRDIKVLEKI